MYVLCLTLRCRDACKMLIVVYVTGQCFVCITVCASYNVMMPICEHACKSVCHETCRVRRRHYAQI